MIIATKTLSSQVSTPSVELDLFHMYASTQARYPTWTLSSIGHGKNSRAQVLQVWVAALNVYDSAKGLFLAQRNKDAP
ncbi:hypothetical protein PILCRDRAFT_826350, partial [Piloderma croceum F 1598]